MTNEELKKWLLDRITDIEHSWLNNRPPTKFAYAERAAFLEVLTKLK